MADQLLQNTCFHEINDINNIPAGSARIVSLIDDKATMHTRQVSDDDFDTALPAEGGVRLFLITSYNEDEAGGAEVDVEDKGKDKDASEQGGTEVDVEDKGKGKDASGDIKQGGNSTGEQGGAGGSQVSIGGKRTRRRKNHGSKRRNASNKRGRRASKQSRGRGKKQSKRHGRK